MTGTDVERAVALRRMKTLATGLLGVLALVFVVAFALQDSYPWLQYVRAAAEGGMVGALADWFAVTALFKHPMGLRIPHTAIIPRKKDQIGESLGQFVEENFLSEDVVVAKLESARIAQKAGMWLEKPESADRLAVEGAVLIRGLFTVLDDDAVQGVIEGLVRRHFLEPPWGPPIGSIAERIFAEGHHHSLVDLLVDRAADWVDGNYAVVTRVVAQRSPTWVPRLVDGVVGDRVHAELSKFIRAVQDDPRHDVRVSIDKYLRDLAQDLQHRPETIARAEEIKAQLLDDPRVRDLTARTWATIKTALLEAVNDPASELTTNFKALVRDFGSRLTSDTGLSDKVNRWIADGASYFVRTYRSEIAGVISETVGRWDAEETSRKIELQVGKDLQFIRINGTVVGSLAGLLIFSIAHAVFG
ncbi:DUF445 family protein [Arthrobacter echini]|uniref:DUF445 family protein n=2 Tax=Arthrobacter TaxID=1663 RepID=A0A5D0XVN3_9MICC|nr:DUF445 family protein [Arthrobacter echini]TYD00671.1 DUF445 family protein [Arthrobacter echini]